MCEKFSSDDLIVVKIEAAGQNRFYSTGNEIFASKRTRAIVA